MAKILVKNSVTSGSSPAGLSLGEIAVNITDRKIFFGNAVESAVAVYDRNAHVLSFNGLTGAIGITSDKNISLTQSGQTLTIGISAARPGDTGAIQFSDGGGGLSASAVFNYTPSSGVLRVGGASRYLTLYNTSLFNVIANNGAASLCLIAPGLGAYIGDPLVGASGTYVLVNSSSADAVTIRAKDVFLDRQNPSIIGNNITGYLQLYSLGSAYSVPGNPSIVLQDADTDIGGIPTIRIQPSTTPTNSLILGYTGSTDTSIRGSSVTITPRSTHVGGITAAHLYVSGGATFIGNISAPNIVNSVNGITGPVGIAAGTNITISASGNTLTINGSTASVITVESSNVNATRYLAFVGGTGATGIFIDDVTTPLSYNPQQGNIGAKKVTLTTSSNVLTVDSTTPNVVLTDGTDISTFGLDSFTASYSSGRFTLSNTANGLDIYGFSGITLDPGSQVVEVKSAVVSDGGYRITSNALNAQTDSYTLQASDNGKIITMNAATLKTITVPSGLPVGFNCTVIRLGTGRVSFVTSGTTINSVDGLVEIASQHGSAALLCYSSNTFNLSGNLG